MCCRLFSDLYLTENMILAHFKVAYLQITIFSKVFYIAVHCSNILNQRCKKI